MEGLSPAPETAQPERAAHPHPRRRLLRRATAGGGAAARVCGRGAWLSVRAFGGALRALARHDAFNLAQSAAYSSVFALFPALVVAATLVPLLPAASRVGLQVELVLIRILPVTVLPLIDSYFAPGRGAVYHTTRALLLGTLVSVWGASGVIATFMEGTRRAYALPMDCWTFLQRRGRALLLVFLSLVPMAGVSVLVVFGEYLAAFFAAHAASGHQRTAYLMAISVRWSMAALGSVGVIALLYWFGTPLRQPWRATVPGALLATSLWLLLTIGFGLYVTHFARYNEVYGSLAAGVALLVWLYLVALSVLCGAEFNGQLRAAREVPRRPGIAAGPEC